MERDDVVREGEVVREGGWVGGEKVGREGGGGGKGEKKGEE